MSIEKHTTVVGAHRYEDRLRDPLGREYSRTFRTRKAAESFEHAESTDPSRGLWVDPRKAETAFDAWATQWLDSDPNKRPKSVVTDETIIRLHLAPTLGARALGGITPLDVQRLVTKWARECAPSSTRRRYATLRAILGSAVEADLIGRSPCRGIKLPSDSPRPRHVVTPEELGRLATVIAPEYRAMVYAGAVLGLRVGECLALRVGRLDLLRGTLTVAESVAEIHGRLIFGEPKSHAGRRTMTVPTPLLELLSEHLSQRALTGADQDSFVFASPEGGPVRYSNWRERVWKPATVDAGLPGLRFHDLRKAAATAMVSGGVDVRTAQSRLGHSDPRLTLAVYAQTTDVADRAAARVLGDHFMGSTDGQPLNVARDGRGMEGGGASDRPTGNAL
ncbi:MAG: site-specific integrase [Acidimicrobiales bacterium]